MRAPNISGYMAEAVLAERRRAHEKHGETSMEVSDWSDARRLAILVEEVGEVARSLNDLRHGADCIASIAALRKELIQVAAMAESWVEACDDAEELWGRPGVKAAGGAK